MKRGIIIERKLNHRPNLEHVIQLSHIVLIFGYMMKVFSGQQNSFFLKQSLIQLGVYDIQYTFKKLKPFGQTK